MKFLDKLGLALFSILVLIIAVILCLISFGWMEPTIFGILIGKVLINATYTNILIGVCIVLILLAIRCLFFSDMGEKDESDTGILLQNEDGRLLITVSTIKDMVDGVIKEFPNIVNSESNVEITKQNDVIIDIIIDITNQTVIKDISSKLQVKIKKTIKSATDLDIKYVNVRVRNAESTSNMMYDEVNEEKTKNINEKQKNEENLKVENNKEYDKNSNDNRESKEGENKAKNRTTSNKSVSKTK